MAKRQPTATVLSYQLTMELVTSESISSSLPPLKVELEDAVLVRVNGVPVGETDVDSDTGVSDCGYGVTALCVVSGSGIHCERNAAASL